MKLTRRLVQIFKEEARPWRFLMSRVLWHAGVSELFSIDIRSEFKLTFFPSSLSASYWMDPNQRADDGEIIRKLVHKGDTVIDVGANIGVLTCEAALAAGHDGLIYSFEPHPRVYSYLTRNISRNGFPQVIPVNMGLAAEEGVLHFTDVRGDDCNHVSENGTGIAVPVTRLDDYLANLDMPRVHLIKIDVEGFELNVLKGALGTLARTDYVLFEAFESQFQRFGYGYREVHELLAAAGFEVFTIHASSQAGPVQCDASYVPTLCQNLLAVRRGVPMPL